MNKIVSLSNPAIKNRAEMESLVAEIARLKLNEKMLVAGMDAEIQTVRTRYESRIATLRQLLAKKTAAARDWAESNLAEFGDRRSLDFRDGTIGFRTNPPKLKALVKWKWDSVLENLRAARWGAAYVRVKEEINKEQIIEDFGAKILSASELRKIGAQVVQEESFYVEPALTKVQEREVAEAA